MSARASLPPNPSPALLASLEAAMKPVEEADAQFQRANAKLCRSIEQTRKSSGEMKALPRPQDGVSLEEWMKSLSEEEKAT